MKRGEFKSFGVLGLLASISLAVSAQQVPAAASLPSLTASSVESVNPEMDAQHQPKEVSKPIAATPAPDDGRANEVVIVFGPARMMPSSGIEIGIGVASGIVALAKTLINTVSDVSNTFSEKKAILFVTNNTGIFKVCQGRWALVEADELKEVKMGQYIRFDRDLPGKILPVVKEGGGPLMYQESDDHPCAKQVQRIRLENGQYK